jgi:hypothetical protein
VVEAAGGAVPDCDEDEFAFEERFNGETTYALHLEDLFVVGSKASARFVGRNVAKDDWVQRLKFVANHSLISKCARVRGVGIMHGDSVDDEGVDAGDSPGRNESRRLVDCGLDRRKNSLHKGSDCWSVERPAIIEAQRYEIVWQ